MIRQLTFDLAMGPALTRQDFFVSPANALALAAVDGWADWPLRKMLLCGPPGAGKTHLAHIWAADTAAVRLTGGDLADLDLTTLPHHPVCIDNADAVAGSPAAETTLFHIHNLQAERRQPLLLTAGCPPRDWGIRLPDLASRMQGTALTRLDPPDDALLSAVLVKLFADLQITVPPTLIPYLISRMDRSFAAARTLVAYLDSLSLAQGRPITRQLAADVLDRV